MDDPLIALLTDFGGRDFFVGSLKAVIAGVNPRARILDISHEVPSFDLSAGSFVLASCYRFFPRGTIFLAVVDPGVGTGRGILLARTAAYSFVAPDNGILTLPLSRERAVEIRRVSSQRFFLTPERTTFEGRDRMAPAAAWLSLGVDPAEFGPRLRGYRRLDAPGPRRSRGGLSGRVVYIDKFGNLITDLPGRWLSGPAGTRPVLTVQGRRIRSFRAAYAGARAGRPFALVNCLGLVEVAVREGSAAECLGAVQGSPVHVAREERR